MHHADLAMTVISHSSHLSSHAVLTYGAWVPSSWGPQHLTLLMAYNTPGPVLQKSAHVSSRTLFPVFRRPIGSEDILHFLTSYPQMMGHSIKQMSTKVPDILTHKPI